MGDAQVDDLARLRHVVGQLLVAAHRGALQRSLDALQGFDQLLVAGLEQLHAGTEGVAQAGQFERARTKLRRDLAGLVRMRSERLRKLLAGAIEQRCGRIDQRIDRGSLRARVLLQPLQQGTELLQQFTAFTQRQVVAFGDAAHLGAQFGDHAGRGLRHFGGRVQQARQRRFQRGAQGCEMTCGFGLQIVQARNRCLAAQALLVAQGRELAAPKVGELVHALAVLLAPARLAFPARLHQLLRTIQQLRDLGERAACCRRALPPTRRVLRDVAAGLGQRRTHSLLLRDRLLAGALPLRMQVGAHRRDRLGGGLQLVLLRPLLRRLCTGQAVGHGRDQARTAAFEGFIERDERALQPGAQRLAAALVLLQRRRPGLRNAARGGIELLRQGIDLALRHRTHALVQALRLLHDLRHRRGDDRADALAGSDRARLQAVLERSADAARELAIGPRDRVLQLCLPCQQLRIELLAAAFDALHHRFESVHHLRQGICLRLHRAHRLLPLVHAREREQGRRDQRVEPAGQLQPFAPADRRHQAQHGRSRDAGHRGAEGKAQALDRRRQRGADRLQVGRALQCEHGALEGDDHAEEGAQHAEHDQQAHEIGRQRRTGQAHALALDAQAHGIAQGRRHLRQPVRELRQRLRHVSQRRGSGQRSRCGIA